MSKSTKTRRRANRRTRETAATPRAGERAGGRRLRARFDAAGSHNETRLHWANADSLAADAASDPAIRAILRQRARYERFNNGFTCGMLRTLANDVVGIGPALQLQTPNETVNSAVERRFDEWARAIGLARKLRLARQVRASDGEVFIRIVQNPAVRGPVPRVYCCPEDPIHADERTADPHARRSDQRNPHAHCGDRKLRAQRS